MKSKSESARHRFLHLLLLFLSLTSGSLAFAVPDLTDTGAENKTVVIATHHAPPFAIETPDGWEGITIELIDRIAKARGFVHRFEEMGLEEMLRAAASGEVSASAAALTLTAEREAMLDFSHPYFTSGLGVAVPRKPEVTWLSAIKGIGSLAFLKTAGALLAVLTMVGVLVWVVERGRNGHFPSDPVRGVGSGIWWSAVTMTTVGYGDKSPVTPAGRILGLIWMFASIIMISGFTAAIATSLTVGHLNQSISGIADLSRKRVLTASASTSAAFLDEKMIRYSSVADIAEALERLRAGQADAVVYDLPILRYLINEEFSEDLVVLPNNFLRQDYGIALPPGNPFREELNQEILRIIQDPEWSRMVESYLGPGV